MSEWIESYASLPRHRKTRRLAKALDISIPLTVGYLHMLWYYALDFAPGGDLSDQGYEDIAEGCGWEGDAEEFITGLVDSGWLEKRDGLFIHDWADYNDSHRKRMADAERQRQKRLRDKENANLSQDVTVTPVTVTPDRQTDRQDRTDRTDRTDTHSSPNGDAGDAEGEDATAALEAFRTLCPSLPKPRGMTEPRRQRLRALEKQLGRESMFAFFSLVECSDFLTGRTGKWCASLDWILKPEHVTRILEGNYDNRQSKASGNVARALELVERLGGEA